jgi:hypothetical protein
VVDYNNALKGVLGKKFPPNPCKLMKLWRDGHIDKELYDSVLTEGLFVTDPNTGDQAQLKDVGAMLSQILEIKFTESDVFKHRHRECVGCSRYIEAGYELG